MQNNTVPGGNDSTSGQEDWFSKDFGGYPVIYQITIHYLYPVVVFARVVNVIWYVIGFIGNIISLRIWSMKIMRKVNPSSPYLICLAICDIAFQVLHTFYYAKYYYGKASLGEPGLCETWNVLNLIPQYGGQLLVFGFTTERLVAIFWPFHGQRFRRDKRMPYVISIILTLSVALAFPQMFFWSVNKDEFCEMRMEPKTVQVYGYWSLITEVLIFTVVPFVTLLFNIFVLRQTFKCLKSIHQSKINANGFLESNKRAADLRHPATRTLLFISFYRILCTLPVSVTYNLQNLSYFNIGDMKPLEEMWTDTQWRRFILYWAVRMIIETIGAAHHALGIWVYATSTNKFRQELVGMFRKKADSPSGYSYHQVPKPSRTIDSTNARTKREVLIPLCDTVPVAKTQF